MSVAADDSKTCHYCDRTGGPFEIDHVRPRSRGGTNHPDNLVDACRDCNRSKSDRTPDEWLGHPCCELHGRLWSSMLLAPRLRRTASEEAVADDIETTSVPLTKAERTLAERAARLRPCAAGLLTDRPFGPGSICTDCAASTADHHTDHRLVDDDVTWDDNPHEDSWRGTVYASCRCGWTSNVLPASRDNADLVCRAHAAHRRAATCAHARAK